MKAKEAIVVQENQLQVILKDSGLEETKAAFILRNFQGYFTLADEWTIKARAIVVTKEDQTAEMEMARTGRLFLRSKRLAIEGARKELKEQALREGKAIDGIANVLKALIVPIEEYLERQEKFVEIQEEKKREAMRIEIEARIEAERIAKEKADAEERERMRLENERLKQEAIELEKQALAERVKAKEERRKQEALLSEERAKADAERKAQEKKLAEQQAKAEYEKKAAEEKARLEREKQEKTLANERARDKRLKELAEEKAEAKLDAERKEKERLAEILKNQIECPNCGHKFQLKERK